MTSKISNKTGDKIDLDTTYHSIANNRIYGHELSAYLEDNIKMNDRLRLNLGLHFSLFQVQKQSYFSLQPRVSARYQLGKDVTLKASYTQMSQYVHLYYRPCPSPCLRTYGFPSLKRSSRCAPTNIHWADTIRESKDGNSR